LSEATSPVKVTDTARIPEGCQQAERQSIQILRIVFHSRSFEQFDEFVSV
jgi:hypothetical protein